MANKKLKAEETNKLEIPNSVAQLLNIDNIQEVIRDFTSNDLANVSELVLIFKDNKGDVWVRTSCNEITLFGLIGLALKATLNDGNEESG